MNEADSRYIAERAVSAGYDVASAPEEANVVVLNTCTVRDSAERRAYGRMNHFKALKARDPSVRLVIAGCLAEQDRERMQQRAPHVDAIFGTRELAQLGDQLAAWSLAVREAAPRIAAQDDVRDNMLRFALGGTADGVTDAFSHLRAFVTVQRGCSYYCTFCIVPHVRGRFDHRPRSAIVDEVRDRVARGARGDHARRPNGECMARCGGHRRLRRSLRGDRAAAAARAPHVYLAAPQGLHAKNPRRPRRHSAAQSTHSPSLAIGQRCGFATNEPQIHAGRLPPRRRIGASAHFRAARSLPTSSSAFPAKPRKTSKPPSPTSIAAFSQTLLRSSIQYAVERPPRSGIRCPGTSRLRALRGCATRRTA